MLEYAYDEIAIFHRRVFVSLTAYLLLLKVIARLTDFQIGSGGWI